MGARGRVSGTTEACTRRRGHDCAGPRGRLVLPAEVEVGCWRRGASGQRGGCGQRQGWHGPTSGRRGALIGGVLDIDDEAGRIGEFEGAEAEVAFGAHDPGDEGFKVAG